MKPSNKKKTILKKKSAINVWIVEDNQLYRKNVVDLVNHTKGMKCTNEFSSSEQAIQNITADNSPDACLLDIGLPGISGIECAARIKALHPRVQIIMITVFDDNDHIFDALCAGASGYLLKASTEGVIIQSITDVMNGGSPMNPAIAKKVITAFTHLRRPSHDLELSKREMEILDLISKGLRNKQISEELCLSPHTIDTHIRNIYDKLHVHTRTEAISKMALR